MSFAHPGQIELAAAICQSFALDNGAFSLWKQGRETDWPGVLRVVRRSGWRTRRATGLSSPTSSSGSEDENDTLLGEWPFGHRGVPVWHLNESAGPPCRGWPREWPRVALGSAAEWDVSNAVEVPGAPLCRPACDLPSGQPVVKLHGLRMLSHRIVTSVPLASADSPNVARNIGIDGNWASGVYPPATKETRAMVLTERIESHQSPACLNEVMARQQRAADDQGVAMGGIVNDITGKAPRKPRRSGPGGMACPVGACRALHHPALNA